MERRRLLEAALHDHAIARSRRGRGTASSRCRSARGRSASSSASSSNGQVRQRLAAALAGEHRIVLVQVTARDRAGNRRPRRAPVGEESCCAPMARSAADRACPAGSRQRGRPAALASQMERGALRRRAVHVTRCTSVSRRSTLHSDGEPQCSTCATWRGCRRAGSAACLDDRTADRWPRCRGRSGRGSPSAKRGTLKTGWYGIGRPLRPACRAPRSARHRGRSSRTSPG